MLLDHNIETYNELCEVIDNFNHALIIQATGSGKSYIVLEYIEEYNLDTLVVVPTHAIGRQWRAKSDLISYVCYDTFTKLNNFDEYDLVVFDEAHHLGAETYEKAFKLFINTGISYIGLTADSVRWTDSGRDISEEYFNDTTIYGLSLKDGLSSKIFPNVNYTIAIYNPSEFLSKYLKNDKISESLIAKLNYTIDNTESIKDIITSKINMSNTKGVVFVDSIDSISSAEDLLHACFKDIAIYIVHSKLSKIKNKESLELFENTNNAWIIAVDMLNEGVHIDGVNTIIMLRRTGSPNVYFQQIGRCISVGNVDSVNIFDLVGNKNLLKMSVKSGGYKTLIKSNLEKMVSDQIIIDDKTENIFNVLDEINNLLDRSWQDWEVDLLKKEYPSKGWEIPELLDNGRTEWSIRTFAHKLGIRKDNYWQDWEVDLLKKEYPSKGSNIPELINNGRTAKAIIACAKSLGISKYKVWQDWELELIKKEYPSKGSNIPELLSNGRTEQAITTCAYGLNISSNRYWEDWEVDLLKKEYPSKGSNIPELISRGKSRNNIRCKASNLGIIKKKDWEDWEIELLKKEYPIKGSDIPELINNGRTGQSIVARARHLGIKYENTNWKDWEIELVKKEYPIKGINIQELINNGRTKRSIKAKAQYLGIKRLQ